MDKKTIHVIGILMIFLAGFACQVSAYAIGASPATLSFNISRGGYEEKTFQISTNSEIPLEFSISVTDSVSSMIKLETKNKTTVSGNPAEIIVRAYASRSAEPANIDGTITALLKPSSNSPSGSGSVVSTGVAVRVKIEITNEMAPLIKNKLAFATIVLVIIMIVLAVIYFVGRTKRSSRKK
jgi:hypothetical protein